MACTRNFAEDILQLLCTPLASARGGSPLGDVVEGLRGMGWRMPSRLDVQIKRIEQAGYTVQMVSKRAAGGAATSTAHGSYVRLVQL